MAGITLAQAEAQLALWLAADTAVSSGQAWSMGERSLTRSNAGEIRANITFWDNKVALLSETRRGPVVRGGTPS